MFMLYGVVSEGLWAYDTERLRWLRPAPEAFWL